jgi:hypothetical protein
MMERVMEVTTFGVHPHNRGYVKGWKDEVSIAVNSMCDSSMIISYIINGEHQHLQVTPEMVKRLVKEIVENQDELSRLPLLEE